MTTKNTVLERASNLNYPPVRYASGSFYLEGADSWQRAFAGGRALMPSDLTEIAAALEAIERRDRALEEARMPERPPVDPSAPETNVERMDRERGEAVNARAARRETADGRAERQIELLERVVELLEKAQTR